LGAAVLGAMGTVTTGETNGEDAEALGAAVLGAMGTVTTGETNGEDAEALGAADLGAIGATVVGAGATGLAQDDSKASSATLFPQLAPTMPSSMIILCSNSDAESNDASDLDDDDTSTDQYQGCSFGLTSTEIEKRRQFAKDLGLPKNWMAHRQNRNYCIRNPEGMMFTSKKAALAAVQNHDKDKENYIQDAYSRAIQKATNEAFQKPTSFETNEDMTSDDEKKTATKLLGKHPTHAETHRINQESGVVIKRVHRTREERFAHLTEAEMNQSFGLCKGTRLDGVHTPCTLGNEGKPQTLTRLTAGLPDRPQCPSGMCFKCDTIERRNRRTEKQDYYFTTCITSAAKKNHEDVILVREAFNRVVRAEGFELICQVCCQDVVWLEGKMNTASMNCRV